MTGESAVASCTSLPLTETLTRMDDAAPGLSGRSASKAAVSIAYLVTCTLPESWDPVHNLFRHNSKVYPSSQVPLPCTAQAKDL